MATAIKTRGGGDEFSHREEIEALIETTRIEIDSYSTHSLGGLAINQAGRHEFMFGPTLRSVVQPDSVRSIPFYEANIQKN